MRFTNADIDHIVQEVLKRLNFPSLSGNSPLSSAINTIGFQIFQEPEITDEAIFAPSPSLNDIKGTVQNEFTIGDGLTGIKKLIMDGINDAELQWDSVNLCWIFSAGSIGLISAPHASAILDLPSTTQGIRGPCMTTAQRDLIGTPAEGLVIYNLTTHKLECWDGSAWQTAW